MNYYTYKKAKKCGYKIVLFVATDDEYIGLSHDRFYKIKRLNNSLIEMFNFLVCYKVKEKSEEYLIPVGYSDKNEWMLQEEYKLNVSDTRSEEEKIINTCKTIKDKFGHPYWKHINKMFNKDLEDLEDIKKAIYKNFNLYKFIHRCFEEKDTAFQMYLETKKGDDYLSKEKLV